MNLSVVHTTAGRFRIRVPQVFDDSDYANKLNWLIESLDFVDSVRINQSASSLIVCYKTSMVSTTAAQKDIFNCIELANVVEIPSGLKSTADEVKPLKAWEHLALPVTALGTALVASLLELSVPLVTGGLIAAAALPVFHRAIAGVVDDRKLKVDVLDSLWITLQTLQGQYVAPALLLGLVESAATIRDQTAISAQRQTLLPSSQRSKDVLAIHLDRANVTNTRVGEDVEAIADGLIMPTLLLSGGIFVLTGNIAPALAPLQLDFATGIGIAVPTTILAALSSAMRSGAYIRYGRAIETLAQIDTIIFATPLPPNSANAIATLTAWGIKTHLVTDDQQAIAHVNLTTLFPEAKIEELRRLHNAGKTIAYVGDKSSDRELLAYVDVFISLAEATDIIEETADVVLMTHDLEALLQAIEIAKQAMRIVYQNIAVVAVPNVSVAIAGIFFGLHPIAAVLINFSAALIAEINGLRPLLSVSYSENINSDRPETVLPTGASL